MKITENYTITNGDVNTSYGIPDARSKQLLDWLRKAEKLAIKAIVEDKSHSFHEGKGVDCFHAVGSEFDKISDDLTAQEHQYVTYAMGIMKDKWCLDLNLAAAAHELGNVLLRHHEALTNTDDN